MPPSEHKEAISFGTYKVPSALPYPRVLTLDETPEIKGQFVYVIKSYLEEGITIVISRDVPTGKVYLSICDFNGDPIDLRDTKSPHPYRWAAFDFAQHDSSKFVAIMKSANIEKIILYVSVEGKELRLVDLRASLDKFYGPGMIRDLFGKIYPTQEVVKTITLDENVLDAIKRGEGSYKGNLILKCSKFKTIVRGKELLPLYVKVNR